MRLIVYHFHRNIRQHAEIKVKFYLETDMAH